MEKSIAPSSQNATPTSDNVASSQVEVQQEQGYLPPGAGNLALQGNMANSHPLTPGRVMALQRSIGNQATTRIIRREFASRKNQDVVQRIATDENLIKGKGLENSVRSKNMWANQQSLDFTTVTLEDFKARKSLQSTVFGLAQKTVDNQKSLGNAVISSTGLKGVDIGAKKKRESLGEFVSGVIEKCESKPYKVLSQMDDMARGRFNVPNKADMQKIVKGIQTKLKVITAPRVTKDGITSYPRYHVITMDDTGMSFEWQVGTKSTTDLYEAREIVVPPSLISEAEKADKHLDAKANIHDISYAVFQRMINKFPETAVKFNVAEFVKKVNLASQKSGDLGESTPEFKGEISDLLAEATQLLTTMVENGATPQIVKLLH